ncbi:MAG: hypothetical protein U0838_13040 [Chloroflexota bacterium]
MALEITAAWSALAAKHAGLANADGSSTLRQSYDALPADPVFPCAWTVLADLSGIEAAGGTGLTGTASFDVLILLEPQADVPRRHAALGKWVMPALQAALAGNALGQPDALAGAVPTLVEPRLAGDSEVYDGLDLDSVRVRYEVPFRLQRAVAP